MKNMTRMQAIKGNKVESFAEARQLEQKAELKAAAAAYRLLHKASPKNTRILQRLMIIYRKLKDASNEVRYIDAAIKIQEQYYVAGKNADKKTVAISKKLNLLLGHTDKKGKAIIKPAELLKLEMRKKRLQDKL